MSLPNDEFGNQALVCNTEWRKASNKYVPLTGQPKESLSIETGEIVQKEGDKIVKNTLAPFLVNQ